VGNKLRFAHYLISVKQLRENALFSCGHCVRVEHRPSLQPWQLFYAAFLYRLGKSFASQAPRRDGSAVGSGGGGDPLLAGVYELLLGCD
jgi:hypothetical protein